MKTPLKISILLNLSLLAAFIYHLSARPAPVAVPAPPMVLDKPAPANVTATNVTVNRPIPTPTGQSAFRWSQLDAKDYHVYVHNLRAIGCPEPTVRAIAAADLDSVYQLIANRLEAKLSVANNASWSQQLSGFSSESELETALQKLPGEEAAKLNDLLGLSAGSMENVAVAAPGAQSPLGGGQAPAANRQRGGLTTQNAAPLAAGALGSIPVGDGSALVAGAYQAASDIQLPPVPASATLPLVFQPVDPAAANLSSSQMQAVNELRQEFASALQGSSQNPADPAYQQAWQQALTQSDRLLEANLGQIGFNQYWDAQWDAQHLPSQSN